MLFSRRWNCGYSHHRKNWSCALLVPSKRIVVFEMKSINCNVSTCAFCLKYIPHIKKWWEKVCLKTFSPATANGIHSLSGGVWWASLPRRGVCRRCPQRAVLVGLHLLRTPGSHLGLISPRTRKATAAMHRTQKKRVSFSRSLAYSICWDGLSF